MNQSTKQSTVISEIQEEMSESYYCASSLSREFLSCTAGRKSPAAGWQSSWTKAGKAGAGRSGRGGRAGEVRVATVHRAESQQWGLPEFCSEFPCGLQDEHCWVHPWEETPEARERISQKIQEKQLPNSNRKKNSFYYHEPEFCLKNDF